MYPSNVSPDIHRSRECSGEMTFLAVVFVGPRWCIFRRPNCCCNFGKRFWLGRCPIASWLGRVPGLTPSPQHREIQLLLSPNRDIRDELNGRKNRKPVIGINPLGICGDIKIIDSDCAQCIHYIFIIGTLK